MRKSFIFAAGVILVAGTVVTAQRGGRGDAAGPPPACPASGFATQAYYAQLSARKKT